MKSPGSDGAGGADGNRTRDFCLEGRHLTIKLLLHEEYAGSCNDRRTCPRKPSDVAIRKARRSSLANGTHHPQEIRPYRPVFLMHIICFSPHTRLAVGAGFEPAQIRIQSPARYRYVSRQWRDDLTVATLMY